MAQKKATTKKRKTTTKKGRETKAQQHARKQMWAVVLFAIGILMLALTFISGDKLWLWLHNGLFGFLGWSAYFIAPLVLYVAVIAAMDKPLSSIKAKLWQTGVLIVMISGANQIFSGMPERAGLITYLGILFENGVAREGGGVFSAVFGWPLVALLGDTGAKIVIVLAIGTFLMLITGSTLVSLYHMVTRPVKEIEEVYTNHVEERAQRPPREPAATPPPAKRGRPAKAKPAQIDIDISGDSDPDEIAYENHDAPGDDLPADMPGHPVTAADTPPWEEPPTVASAAAAAAARPFVFGEDSPVEYIAVEPPVAAPTLEEPPRPHPLLEDIEEVGGQDKDYNISQVVDRALSENPVVPLDLEDTFIPGELPQGAAVSELILPNEPGDNELVSVKAEPQEPVLLEQPVRRIYNFPPINLLKMMRSTANEKAIREELESNSKILEDTLRSFGVQTRVLDICRGPAVTRYEIQPSAGVKISKITGLADDIALSLAAAGIRIEAPIPNKSAVGIEVPNRNVSIVGIRELIESQQFKDAKSGITIALGKDIAGNLIMADIGKMPHLLVAGATGSGKSVCINSIIISLLYKSSPDDVKFLMIDPKMVELGVYNGIPHLLIPVVTDPKKAAGALSWAVSEMLGRYESFKQNAVRDIEGYNRLARTNPELEKMPQIVIIIDELADLMMTSPKEVEDAITRLAQMARAAGMHLIIATQRPSVSVITGDIKVNIPSRIAFAVSSQFDSRTILDMGGAERLLGRGDMLFYPVGSAKPVRVQGCLVSDKEVEKVVEFIKESDAEVSYDQSIVEQIDRHVVAEKGGKDSGGGLDEQDEMLPAAIECVVEAGQASTSQLQRRLKLGYARAARIIDELEVKGIVGPSEGSKPRQVLMTRDQWIEMRMNGAEQALLSGDSPTGTV